MRKLVALILVLLLLSSCGDNKQIKNDPQTSAAPTLQESMQSQVTLDNSESQNLQNDNTNNLDPSVGSQIVPGVYLVEDSDTCIYVVEGEEAALVIDSGYGFKNLRARVEKITSKPLILVLTHGHLDHVSGAFYFDKVFMNKDDLALFNSYQNHKPNMRSSIRKDFGLTDQEIDKWMDGKVKKLQYLKVGNTIEVGGNALQIISLKGHTIGSIGILDRKHRILFSGDGVINQVWMQLKESTSLTEYKKTLESLEAYEKDFDYIYLGHCKNFQPVAFIDKVMETLDKIIGGEKGEPFNNPIAKGEIYRNGDCEVVYNPKNIK